MGLNPAACELTAEAGPAGRARPASGSRQDGGGVVGVAAPEGEKRLSDPVSSQRLIALPPFTQA